MKSYVLCGLSAFIGATLALAIYDGRLVGPAGAQEKPGAVRGAVFSLEENRAFAPTNLPNVFNHEGLAPDEAVNVAVYDATNKSVVNINTKSSHSALLAFEVTSEGTGSGSILDKLGHVVTSYHVIADANSWC